MTDFVNYGEIAIVAEKKHDCTTVAAAVPGVGTAVRDYAINQTKQNKQTNTQINE
jgi:hypothetical protein